eukprot:7539747-Pyramimonas_sp.AAC.1
MEGEYATSQAVLAFETADGGNVANLMYDGMRFFYYDDYILDAPTKPKAAGAATARDEWHLITLAVSQEGEGFLYVDNDQFEHFTTRSNPAASSRFTVGADYLPGGATLGSFFSGRVDRLHAYDAYYLVPDQATMHLTVIPSTALVARFLFDGNLTYSVASSGVLRGAGFVASSVPWTPPLVLNAAPVFGPGGGASGGQKVHVQGANFAKSNWCGPDPPSAPLPSGKSAPRAEKTRAEDSVGGPRSETLTVLRRSRGVSHRRFVVPGL